MNKMYLKPTVSVAELQAELGTRTHAAGTVADHANAIATGAATVYQGQSGGMLFVSPQKTSVGKGLVINNMTDPSLMNHHNMRVLRGHAKQIGATKIIAHTTTPAYVNAAVTQYGFKIAGSHPSLGTILVHGVH